ncbi:MAG TPA: alcohol dehydrogenase [Deltaproteobacteria bacterium]|nr:MAG: alcohol dehydrogenase [Deltaproteobacteria bacterium GWA2_55_82]OGQ65145.1 MAG: alcohol dehydrogenase [Deltaproteobacteria bacterium RIFCSPLOWO2_02_FULL_55_12]OIJ74729.1 MAG: alcohol dehydrogenase [Deltaproteobacteria bacterium GWC2_55_46]HBG45652.1 alcohol dehydrogenase [Deltaproteobacteria bacterium]HCY12155.1 alcohol dehydrogenase [Deltaproteobacteria bacterium]
MKALVYHGPGKKAWEERPKPVVREDMDAIVRVFKTTICGTDLHILKGDVPEVSEGRVLGHEGIGVIDEVGSGVRNFKKGDRVLISCITSDGSCEYCKKGMYSHCEHGGWVLGRTIDGTQAEYVRIPYADTSLYRLPEGMNEDAFVMLSDVLPTAFECGVLNGQIKPGDTVAIIGAGPIGLAVLLTAKFYSPERIIVADVDEARLSVARELGATVVYGREGRVVEDIMGLTGGRGVDVAIEAVGMKETFGICESIVAPGGHIASIGVFGESVDLHMERLWAHNITLTTRLVDTVTTPMLLKSVASGALHPERLVTHHFGLAEIMKAYDTFSHAREERAIKVVLENR